MSIETSCRSKLEAATRNQAGWLTGRQAGRQASKQAGRQAGRQATGGDNLTTRSEEPVFHGGLSRKLRARRYDEPKG